MRGTTRIAYRIIVPPTPLTPAANCPFVCPWVRCVEKGGGGASRRRGVGVTGISIVCSKRTAWTDSEWILNHRHSTQQPDPSLALLFIASSFFLFVSVSSSSSYSFLSLYFIISSPLLPYLPASLDSLLFLLLLFPVLLLLFTCLSSLSTPPLPVFLLHLYISFILLLLLLCRSLPPPPFFFINQPLLHISFTSSQV